MVGASHSSHSSVERPPYLFWYTLRYRCRRLSLFRNRKAAGLSFQLELVCPLKTQPVCASKSPVQRSFEGRMRSRNSDAESHGASASKKRVIVKIAAESVGDDLDATLQSILEQIGQLGSGRRTSGGGKTRRGGRRRCPDELRSGARIRTARGVARLAPSTLWLHVPGGSSVVWHRGEPLRTSRRPSARESSLPEARTYGYRSARRAEVSDGCTLGPLEELP